MAAKKTSVKAPMKGATKFTFPPAKAKMPAGKKKPY